MVDKLLVTGHRGLVGSAIAELTDVIKLDCNLKDSSLSSEAFRFHSPKHVIHCAGKVGGLGANMSCKGEFFYDNVMINMNVIESSRLAGVEKLVSFLSTCVFPQDVTYPLTEDQVHKGFPHDSNYPYAYAKRMADIQIKAYREQYGVNYASVIPCNIYGPRDNFSMTCGHIIPSIVHKAFLALTTGCDLVIWGTGNPLREFIFSEDVARLSLWAVENYSDEEPIIFSTSQEVSIGDVVSMITKELNYTGKVVFDKSKSDGQHRKPSSNAKLKRLLPDFKFTPLDVGISKTVQWFISNFENARK